jgi:hypothetical protein
MRSLALEVTMLLSSPLLMLFSSNGYSQYYGFPVGSLSWVDPRRKPMMVNAALLRVQANIPSAPQSYCSVD